MFSKIVLPVFLSASLLGHGLYAYDEDFSSLLKSDLYSGSPRIEGLHLSLESVCDNRDLDTRKNNKELDYLCQGKDLSQVDRTESFEDILLSRSMDVYQLESYLNEYSVTREDLRQSAFFIPLDLSNKDLLIFAASTSLGLVVFKNDEEIKEFSDKNRTDFTTQLTDFTDMFGRELIFPTIIGSYFLGAVYQDDKLKKIGLYGLTAGIATQILTDVTKQVSLRSRPRGDLGAYHFGEKGNYSFFSGHSSAAWSIATVIAEIYKEDYRFVPYLAYGAAALGSYARVHKDAHWPSDVLFGAIAGHFVTKSFIRYYEGQRSNPRESGYIYIPRIQAYDDGASVTVDVQSRESRGPLECEKLPDGPGKFSACLQESLNR